ncbi:PTS sugar transporter subunit IIC [Lentilactobacillus hilgardii]|uniref:PTS sugar transporter subunit IIC n=1 Tax=Lentilactobacillus hilgardii TaxID=1588 RepID=UPI00390C4B4A
MGIISGVLVLLVAFFVGMDDILDEWQLFQPMVACTLVGAATGNISVGIFLGATLQMITIGWMNVGAAVAPDIGLPAVISALLVCGPAAISIKHGIAFTIPFAVVGQLLNVFIRKRMAMLIHRADQAAEEGNLAWLDRIHLLSLGLQGLRVVVPTFLVMLISPRYLHSLTNRIPSVITNGIDVSIGMIAAVGFAIIMNMTIYKNLWWWLLAGFLLAVLSGLNIFILTIVGIILTIIYIWFSNQHPNSSEDSSDIDEQDNFDKELDDL